MKYFSVNVCTYKKKRYLCIPVLRVGFRNADVAKLVDALDLGSSAARHGGSSPSIRTEK